jgi:5-methylcytosine-specific restriction endonuclease McrA
MQINRKQSRLPTREHEVKVFNYQSPKWKKVRIIALKRDGYLCQACNREGNTVDHKMPVSKGGHGFKLDNLQTLCESCHAKKSQTERTDR